MKFFTRAWATGELTDSASDEIISAYQGHLNALTPQLPAALRCLARELSLEDGLIRRVVYDQPGRELRLELRSGDLQMGYFDLDLLYLGAILDLPDVAALKEAARDAATEVWYDEVDVADDGAFLHRLLFYPSRECEIMFRALGVRLMPRANRSLPFFPDRYVEAVAPAS